ncbi:MAG TPA: hypothetical protein VM936_14030 [Pyrinomonadaceae bacterium]|jgi:hypothetical protein|nr:hypothetical protein [Pyrinomonadaceae bacterium]
MTTERRRMKSDVFGLACAVVALALCAAGSHAYAREDKVEESMMTGAGSLDIVRVGGEDELQWELRLGKKPLESFGGASFVHFVAHFPQLSMGEVVVVSVNSGGNACPAQFRVVRIVENGARVSEEFGDCADSPTITLKQLPEEEITFGFPGYYQLWQTREPGFVRPAPTTYVYKKGVLKELKAAGARRRGRS